MNLGRKIFFDLVTGNSILDTGEWENAFREKTVEEEIATYTVLNERNRDTFDVLELPYGAYSQDFAECNGYRVNVTTKTLEFSYPDPNQPVTPPVYQKPLTEQLTDLKDRQALSEEAIDFLIMNGGI